MPILTLKISANAQLKDANALAQVLMTLSTHVLHKRADVTSVVLQRMADGEWWVGGETVNDVLVQLDIRITQGTNSEVDRKSVV